MIPYKHFLLITSGILCPLVLAAQNLDWKTAASYTKKPVKASLTSRLTSYVKQDTNTSAEQLKFAKALLKELRQYGLSGTQEKNGLVQVKIPSNIKGNVPEVVFIARTDASATAVSPQIHENYKGGEIAIQASPRLALDIYNAPQLTRAYGHDLLTASGQNTLGTSTKAGATIAMEIARFLDEHPSVSHGPITLLFVPGQAGLKTLLDKKPNTPYIYTLEGTQKGELSNQIFNIQRFDINFEGNRQVALGDAINSAFADNLLIASDFHSLLPRANRPETTSGDKGFIYVDTIEHAGDHTHISGEIQAFSEEEMQRLTAEVTRAFTTVKAMHHKAKDFSLSWKEEQKNLASEQADQALLLAEKAMQKEEISSKRIPTRIPNSAALLAAGNWPIVTLFTGHYNDNTQYEYADLDEMEASFRTAMQILTQVSIPEKND